MPQVVNIGDAEWKALLERVAALEAKVADLQREAAASERLRDQEALDRMLPFSAGARPKL